MNFIFITREGYDQPGARVRCYGLSSELKKRGIDSKVFSFVDHIGAKAGNNETRFSLWEKMVYAKRGFFRLLKEKKTTFVISRFNYHALPAWLASKLRKVPFIFDMDDWEAREDIGYYFNIFPKSKAEYLTRLMAKDSSLCIAASHYLKDYLHQFNKNVFYLPTCVDLNKFNLEPLNNKDRFIFSWHGSVNRREVLDYISFIIECFAILKEKYDFIKLSIRGDGIFGNDLRRLIERNASLDIEYKGWLKPDDMPQYLEAIDVGLVPLLDRSRFNLSKSPVKLLEYMALGRPVITSSIGEAKYIVKSGYNGFLASDKDEFIFDMEELIKDPSRVKTMGINAHKTVKDDYSLELMGERLYKIILDNFK